MPASAIKAKNLVYLFEVELSSLYFEKAVLSNNVNIIYSATTQFQNL